MNIRYRINRFKWALSAAIHQFRRPLRLCQSYSWKEGDHRHICYAARILTEKDFREVCPIAKNRTRRIENDDFCCDSCPYNGIVDFYTDDGIKRVDFTTYTH